MFASNILLALVVVGFICTAASLGEQDLDDPTVWYIWPTTPASGVISCPSEQPCYSLQETLENRNLTITVFRSNSKVVFLSGIHTLEFNEPTFIAVVGVDSLTLQGDDNVTTGLYGFPEPATNVVCQSAVGLAFVNAVNLSLVNLTFSGCGANITETLNDLAFVTLTHGVHVVGDEQKAALFLINTHNIHIEHCSIQSSRGFGILGVNTLGESIISRSLFIANNIYILNTERCQFNPDDNSDYTACNGGNMLLLFEDLFDCPEKELHYTLTIENTIFALGITTYSGYISSEFLTRGTGFGAILSQSTYGVDIVLNSVTSYGNGAAKGANFYFEVYKIVRNSSIALVNCNSLDGNNALVRTDNFLQVSDGVSAGLHLEYGTSTPYSSPQPICSGVVNLPKEILNVSNCTFANNSAVTAAGMYVSLDLNDQRGSTAGQEILVRVLVENTTFVDNQGLRGAGIYIAQSSTINVHARALVSINNSTFSRNANTLFSIRNLTDLAANYHYSVLEVVSANVSITDTKFSNNEGSAMSLFASTALLGGNTIFDTNSGITGGAMDLENSFIYIRPNTNLSFTNNFALQKGGAIYTVQRADIRLPCFYQVYDPEFHINPNVHLYFENNFAQEAGSVLYGGFVDTCFVEATSYFSGQSSTYVFEQIATTGPHSNETSLISSEPLRVCPCTDGLPDCDTIINAQVYSGGTFVAPVVALGQRNGTTPAIIYSIFNPEFNKTGSILPLQSIQQTEKSCSNFTFNVKTDSTYSTIVLTPSRNLIEASSMNLVINVIILPCPPGFVLQNGLCVCDPVEQVSNYELTCNLDDLTIHRLGGSWVNASYDHNGTYTGLTVHKSCPYDYCKANDSDVNLLDPDTQCNFNRTGILCGACKPGLSISLSTSQCKKCSNATIALVLAYAVAGITLVAVLFLLNLTLSMGTLSGFIFYANVVHINRSIFFPQGSLNFVTVLIAWVNLHPGTDYCFYDGMDSYAWTWLNYAFPLYILFIVTVIILVSRHSTRVARLCGSTAVHVLATLILLSYTRLLQTVVISLSARFLLLPDGTFRLVWSSDGNIDFLRGKHIALGLFSILLLVFFLIPYAVFLIVAPTPCGQSLTKYRLFKWINNLKPFLDAHTGHFNDHYRYWTGFLLLVRMFISLFFTFNLVSSAASSMHTITIEMLLLMTPAFAGGGVYKEWPRNLLECSFFINLGIFAVSTLYVLQSGGNQEALSYISGLVALLEFLGIIVYHIYCQLHKVKRARGWLSSIVSRFRMLKKNVKEEKENVDLIESTRPVLHTSVNLREPLLDVN